MADKEHKEIRITHVNPSVHQDLVNISKNLGISMAGLLKPKLKEIADSFQPDMKKVKN